MRSHGRRRVLSSIAVLTLLVLNMSAGTRIGTGLGIALAADPLTPTSFASPPVAVGGTHTCALPGDGSVLCWGDNAVGQLGDGEVTDPSAPAGDVLAIQTVIATTAGAGGNACTDLSPDGSVVRCHSGDALGGVTALAAGFAHTCALLADTTVRCWGANAAIDGGQFSPSSSGGQLGDGTTTSHPYPVAVIAGPGQSAPLSGVTALTAASDYTCALITDGSAKCWGNAMQATSPAPLTVMADAAHPLQGITALAAGDTATCALLNGGAVDCWGSNIEGLLGDGGVENASTMPVKVLGAGSPSLPMSGASGLVMGHDIPVGENGVPAGHACVIDSDVTSGAVHCWGVSDSGQLGQSSSGSWLVITGAAPLDQVTALAAGTLFSCALRADGSVDCWGGGFGATSSNGLGAANPVPVLPGQVVAIAAGGGFCAVFGNGSLSCLNFGGGTGMVSVPGLLIAAPAATPKPTATPRPTPAPTPEPTSAPTTTPGPTPAPMSGDWRVTYGSPAVLTMSGTNVSYALTAKSRVQVTGSSCFLPPGTLIATFSGSGGTYSGQHGLWQTSDCSFARWVPMTLKQDGGTLTAVLAGIGERPVFTRIAAVVPAQPSPPTSLRESVATPAEVTLDPVIVAQSIAIAAAIVILVPFPGTLFNSTLEEHYVEIVGRVRRARRRLRAMFARTSPRADPESGHDSGSADPDQAERTDGRFWKTPLGIVVFILLSALLYGFLDPTFGLDLQSLATLAGLVAGLVLTLLAFDLPIAIVYHRSAVRFSIRALPATLAVGLACVLITRLTDFHPGYLYGLVIAFAVAEELSVAFEGKAIAIATTGTLVVAVVAWFGLLLVDPLIPVVGEPGPALIALQTTLAMAVVAGVELAVFGMLPLRFLPGDRVYRWNRRVWAALFGIGVFGFLYILMNPSSGYLADTTRTPLVTIVVLLLFFGIGSVAFWAYFRFRSVPVAPSAM